VKAAVQNNHRLQNASSSRRSTMAVAMKLSDELVEAAKPYAAAEHRSVPQQIE
jgi:hypothetical protein